MTVYERSGPHSDRDTPGQVSSENAGSRPALTLAERFERFHEQNPEVYAGLVRLARRFHRATGRRDQSVQRLTEILRWDEQIRTKGVEEFAVNNSFRAFYSRLIQLQEPDLDGTFVTRVSPEADRWIAIRRHFGSGT